jgi:uncharacterized protein YbjT (DUF2867 family)
MNIASTYMTNQNRILLVTGATGNVGNELVKQLTSFVSSNLKIGIRAAVHSQNNVDKLAQHAKSVEIVTMDYNKPETVAAALDNVSTLFLLTLPSLHMANTSLKVISEAKKNGVEYVVKQSVFGADAEPGILIGRLHRQEEKIIEESGIAYTFIRPSAFMQNLVNYFGYTIKTQNAIFLPVGEGKVSFVDARDVAAVAAKLLLRTHDTRYDNTAISVTGSEALSYSQCAEVISKQIGRKIAHIDVTEEDARKGLKGMGTEDWLVEAILEEFQQTKLGNRSRASNTVEEILGRKPNSFGRFVNDYVNAFS